ncbi:ATP-binding protein [Streptomyces nanshensis]|uniref:ATP-binding protein n=1 Tax=Streptomyces nanshensis TaxID=518642 RepID=UPI00085C0E1E|nr:ATP-binding protein [Streptomyces nanshensis]
MTSTRETAVDLPEPAVILLLGVSGSGKSTLARTWPADSVLTGDVFHKIVCGGDMADQTPQARNDAAAALTAALTPRLRRKYTTIIDATNSHDAQRRDRVTLAHEHGMHAVAICMTTPLEECLRRNARRPAATKVPPADVRRQHERLTRARPHLKDEGFDLVVTSTQVARLGTLLQRASDTRRQELGFDGNGGLGRQLLVRQVFGRDIEDLATWQSEDGPVRDGDRLTIGLGSDALDLTYRPDENGGPGFDATVPCPNSPCPGPAWQPAHSATDLLAVHNGQPADPDDTGCDTCGLRPTPAT